MPIRPCAARPRPRRSTTPTTTSRRPSVDRPGQPGAAGDPARQGPAAAAARAGAGDRGPRPQRGPAQGPRHEPEPHDGRLRLRAGRAADLDPPARPDARDRQRDASPSSTPPSRRRARGPATSCPASTRRRRRSTPASRGSTRRASCCSRPSSRASLATCRPASRDLARLVDTLDRAVPAGRPPGELRRRGAAADRRRPDPGRVRDRPAELPRVRVRAGRALRRGPELRRQRRATCTSRRAAASTLKMGDGTATGGSPFGSVFPGVATRP